MITWFGVTGYFINQFLMCRQHWTTD